ncbi:MAG: hypothetical protein AAGF60_16810 [Pseudomonadota bacterium]
MIRALMILMLLAGCGRPLTDTEIAFSQTIHGDMIDASRVRFLDKAPVRAVTFKRPVRPRVTCRERILPPIEQEFVTSKPAAVALFNAVWYDRDWYLDDYLPDYPDEIGLIAAMLLAHELTHVWQWQNRKLTGYHPLKAAAEHTRLDDPYLFDADAKPNFLDYGYEQQGALVEEFVCCRALAPQAPRTKRLHALISQVMPVAALPQSRPHDVRMPWDGADIARICD